MERLHTMRWNASTLRGGSSPHYAMEGLHTTRWKVSTLRGGTSPHYAVERLHTTRWKVSTLWFRSVRSYGFGLSDPMASVYQIMASACQICFLKYL
ncbi:MAG: hypothetical protein LBB43_06835 [Spirochaetaceae bacterium]|nr:hypothetical protein [Spirochaetaceae bacterium]